METQPQAQQASGTGTEIPTSLPGQKFHAGRAMERKSEAAHPNPKHPTGKAGWRGVLRKKWVIPPVPSSETLPRQRDTLSINSSQALSQELILF